MRNINLWFLIPIAVLLGITLCIGRAESQPRTLICHPAQGDVVMYHGVRAYFSHGLWRIYDPATGQGTHTNMACEIQVP